MKIALVNTAYPSYLKAFYRRHPRLEDEAYERQKATLAADAFGWGDFWSRALAPLGYEVAEFTANNQKLQAAWARERNLDVGDDWALGLAAKQVREYAPDVLYVDGHNFFTRSWVEALREQVPSIRLVLGWCGAPYLDGEIFQAFDVVLSCIPELVEHFRSLGHKSEHLNHAFEPNVLERLPDIPGHSIDFSFVGQVSRGKGAHSSREALLTYLCSAESLIIFSPAADFTVLDGAKSLAKRGLYQLIHRGESAGLSPTVISKVPVLKRALSWPEPPVSPNLPHLKKYLRPGVFGMEMFQTLRNSKVSLNSHIDASPRSASNMRMFEATGVGSCLLTDSKDNLSDLFEENREVVTYQSAEDCLEKAKWLRDHPQERSEIAAAGQRRTLRDHTFKARAPRLDSIIKGNLR